MLRPYAGLDPAQFHDVRTDLHAELFQQQLADRATGDTGHRFACAGPLQDVARVPAVVLERAREVGVTRAGTRDLTAPLGAGRVGLGGHYVLPVLPVAVPHEHRDGRAERLARAYARETLELGGL